jgi:hypothetical protein
MVTNDKESSRENVHSNKGFKIVLTLKIAEFDGNNWLVIDIKSVID